MRTRIFSWMTMVLTAVLMVSCAEDPAPAPVVEIFFEADATDQYTINFTTVSENATSFAWDFGDMEVGTGAAVSHTYATSGDYTVTVTATGEGGDAVSSKSVTIAADMAELISGGSTATEGKTWKLSRTATPGVDGAGSVRDDFVADLMPGTDDQLDLLGLGAEYDNLFTFYHDGSYSINNVDGNNLAGWIYAALNVPQEDWVIMTDIGLFSVKSTPPATPTWGLTEDTDLVIEAVDEVEGGPHVEKTVTFADADYITFGGGGFLASQDLNVYAIVREVSSTRMVATIFMHSVMDVATKPSHMLSLSFDAQ